MWLTGIFLLKYQFVTIIFMVLLDFGNFYNQKQRGQDFGMERSIDYV